MVGDAELLQADGRIQRSQRSREKILRAYWELMLGGDMEPSAAAIAEHAGVGLRSVFRHFDDLDTLLLELRRFHLTKRRAGALALGFCAHYSAPW